MWNKLANGQKKKLPPPLGVVSLIFCSSATFLQQFSWSGWTKKVDPGGLWNCFTSYSILRMWQLRIYSCITNILSVSCVSNGDSYILQLSVLMLAWKANLLSPYTWKTSWKLHPWNFSCITCYNYVIIIL